MVDLNSLAIFAKVAETRSFSEAARRLKMPISTVSRRVAELEDQLGVGLLERSTRNLRLTDLGAEVFEHAQRSAERSLRERSSARASSSLPRWAVWGAISTAGMRNIPACRPVRYR
jgi:DNA-binding transcriptional LysR family regulator